MEKPDNRAFIYEISQAITQIEIYLAQVNNEDFMEDRKLQDAVIHAFRTYFHIPLLQIYQPSII